LGNFERGALWIGDVGVTEAEVIVLSEGFWPDVGGGKGAATAGNEVSDDSTATHDEEWKL